MSTSKPKKQRFLVETSVVVNYADYVYAESQADARAKVEEMIEEGDFGFERDSSAMQVDAVTKV